MCCQVLLILFLFIINTKCEFEGGKKCKKFAHYFRKQIEEIEDTTITNMDENDDPRTNLVEFLIKNANEIFDGLADNTEKTENITESTSPTLLFTVNNQTDTLALSEYITNSSLPQNDLAHDVMMYENLTLTTLIDKKRHDTHTEHYQYTERNELLLLSKDVKYFGDVKESRQAIHDGRSKNEISMLLMNDTTDIARSCIACDNVHQENCIDPKNKLISSTVCEREDDLCYSLHTPFGIIDRGCFNVNHNLTTYVCSCNLCNYISISEMPFLFSNKQDWVDNVIELSRMRRFRKSVFKDMSCLRCEVNATTKVGDMLDSANCMEGNIGNLPVEECEEDEICAVKAVRGDGYIWRGCSKEPLYNYWLGLCSNDLCNYDTLISIYDYVQEAK